MATLTTLRSAVYNRIGLDSTASGTEETLVTGWLNEAVREVLLRTHCYVKCIDLTLTSGSWKYDLPSTALAVKKVIDSSNRPVEVVTPTELFEHRMADSASSAVPLRVAFYGSNLLLVWPTPTGASVLEAFYVPRPTEMTVGTHDPSNATYGGIPVEFHHAIELWALAKASDYGHEQRTQNGLKYMAEFDQYILKVVRPAVMRKGGQLGRAMVGPRRGRYRPANDVYPAWH